MCVKPGCGRQTARLADFPVAVGFLRRGCVRGGTWENCCVFARENRPESEQIDPKKEAKLVMFTGVRYERRETDEDDQARHRAQAQERQLS